MQKYILISREFFKTEFWRGLTTSQFNILFAVLSMTKSEPTKETRNGKAYDIEAGAFISNNKLIAWRAADNGVTNSKVSAALKKFERYGLIKIRTLNKSDKIIKVQNTRYICCCDPEKYGIDNNILLT